MADANEMGSVPNYDHPPVLLSTTRGMCRLNDQIYGNPRVGPVLFRISGLGRRNKPRKRLTELPKHGFAQAPAICSKESSGKKSTGFRKEALGRCLAAFWKDLTGCCLGIETGGSWIGAYRLYRLPAMMTNELSLG